MFDNTQQNAAAALHVRQPKLVGMNNYKVVSSHNTLIFRTMIKFYWYWSAYYVHIEIVKDGEAIAHCHHTADLPSW